MSKLYYAVLKNISLH